MKKKPLFMFLITIYLIQILLFYILSPTLFESNHTPLSASKYFLIALYLFSFVLVIINILTAFLGLRRSSSDMKKNTLGAIMRFKLALIPFFVIHAFWFMGTMAGVLNPFLYILTFIIPFLFSFYAYMVLLSTSSYLIIQIINMGINKTLTKKQCVIHIIMQSLFFTDVIDSVYLFFKYRKQI